MKVLSAFDNYFLQAQRIRKMVRADFDRVFRAPNPLRLRDANEVLNNSARQVDVILHPSAVGPATLLSDIGSMSALEAYLQDVLTVPASLAGLPALSVPMGQARNGWPLGVSIVSQWGHDHLVLDIGSIIEHID